MPEFLLRYKLPKDVDDDWLGGQIRQQALDMALLVQAKAKEVFFGWNVVFEVRKFDHSYGMPDFYVTGWITDNKDEYVNEAITAQDEILTLMQQLVYDDQSVGCWWQRVGGKWGRRLGLMKRP